MAITTSGLDHIFTVREVDKTFLVDTILNVVKRRERVIYRDTVPPENANVAFAGSLEVVANNNLSITDRSTSLDANRLTNTITTLENVGFFFTGTEKFVLTDEFTEETATVVPVPLFFKHPIDLANLPRQDDRNFLVASGVSVSKIEVLDSNFQAIKVAELKIDTSRGLVFNNLESEFNSTGDFTVFYIKYVVTDGPNVISYTEILNNEASYVNAEFEDLSSSMQIKQDGRKVFLIEEVGDKFEVILPNAGNYAFKPVDSSRIQILTSVRQSITDPWNVRVSNGRFFTRIEGIQFKYHIAEFLSQTFNPAPPIKRIQSESSTVVSRGIIKLDNADIHQDPLLELFISVQISDRDDNALVAFTTDPSLAGTEATNGKTYQRWSNLTRIGIRSVDSKTGFLDIDGFDLRDSYEITSDYYFEEINYEYSLINFNPISNNQVLKTRASLFIIPDLPFTTSVQTVFFLISDETGKIIESNWSDFDNDTQTYIDGELIYYEDFPDFLQTTNSSGVDFLPPTSHKFIPEFTTETSGIFLVLGDITVAEAQHVKDVTTIDSRIEGGGLIEDRLEEAKELIPEVEWFWDEGYWDGIPYPGNASYFVEIPVEIMQGAGGVFLANEIRDVVDRHTAAGVYPVIKAYGIEITISGITSTTNSITLNWQGHGF